MHPNDYERLRNGSQQSGQVSLLRDSKQASNYLLERHGISRSPATLNKLRVLGSGPAFRKIGARHVAYEEAALDDWAAGLISRPMRSTSEAA